MSPEPRNSDDSLSFQLGKFAANSLNRKAKIVRYVATAHRHFKGLPAPTAYAAKQHEKKFRDPLLRRLPS